MQVDLDNIVTDNEVFMAELLMTFRHLRYVLQWELDAKDRLCFFVSAAASIGPTPVTKETLPLLQQCLRQVEEAAPGINAGWGVLLYIARQNNQEIGYAPVELRPLFGEDVAP